MSTIRTAWLKAFVLVVSLWLGALAAMAYAPGNNLIEFLGRFSEVLERPFSMRWTEHTLPFMAGAAALAFGGVFLYETTRQNRRPGEEHGSARWGNVREIDRKYRDKDPQNNAILTQHLQMGLNGKKHRRNLLQIVVGGSGAGKTRFLVKPNLMLANASFIATDPKGELLRDVAPLLLRRGYVVRVLDLVDPKRSNHYNPFWYIRKDADVFRLSLIPQLKGT